MCPRIRNSPGIRPSSRHGYPCAWIRGGQLWRSCLVCGDRMRTRSVVAIGVAGLLLVAIAAVIWAWQTTSGMLSTIGEVEKLNGAVDDDYPPRHVTFAIGGVDAILDDSSCAQLLPHIERFFRLETLDISGTKVTADGLKGIDELTTLRRLDVPDRCISEATIPKIAVLRLESLYIYGTHVPDSFLQRLRRMSPTTSIHVVSRRWSQPEE
jgi:hypothetical protein